jgi:hypothetical protein
MNVLSLMYGREFLSSFEVITPLVERLPRRYRWGVNWQRRTRIVVMYGGRHQPSWSLARRLRMCRYTTLLSTR